LQQASIRFSPRMCRVNCFDRFSTVSTGAPLEVLERT
jgi:hypothetical protein